MTGSKYPVWTGSDWIEVSVPEMDGEGLKIPNVVGVVYNEARNELLMQRRDKPGEAVQGRLELPGGRWGAGESAADAVAREVLEETGVTVVAMVDAATQFDFPAGLSIEATHPAAVVVGLHGAYPALLVAYECVGEGSPRPVIGETTAPAWWAIDDVKAHLDADPDDFVWQSAVVLRTVLGS